MLQVDMTLKLQVKINRPEFTLEDGDETKLFESEFQWLITRLAKKLPSRIDVIWGLKSCIGFCGPSLIWSDLHKNLLVKHKLNVKVTKPALSVLS